MEEPRISIVVPVYNAEDTLDKCVRSILNQTFHGIEIILVDDGSTDRSARMCDAFSGEDARICVLHKENGGLSDARNEGLKRARGEYVLYVDADDFLDPDACRQMLRGAKTGIDLIAGAYRNWNHEESKVVRREPFADGERMNSHDFMLRTLQNCHYTVQAWAYMYRRQFLIRNGLFYRKGWLYEDLDLAPRLFMKASEIMNIDYAFYNHVTRTDSITTSGNSRKKIHDNVGVLAGWKSLTEGVEDRTLQKWMNHELRFSYINMCKDRELTGWWIEGLDFTFALRYSFTIHEKLSTLKHEAISVYSKVFSRGILPEEELKTIIEYQGIYPKEEDAIIS